MEEHRFLSFSEASTHAKHIATNTGRTVKVECKDNYWLVIEIGQNKPKPPQQHVTSKNSNYASRKNKQKPKYSIGYKFFTFIMIGLPLLFGPLYVLGFKFVSLICFILPLFIAAGSSSYSVLSNLRAVWFYSTILGIAILFLIK